MALRCIDNSNTLSRACEEETRSELEAAKAARPSIVIRAQAFAPLSPPDAPLVKLYADLRTLFSKVNSMGVEINRFQSEKSFEILDSGVRSLIGSYITAGHQDWRRFTGFNPLHYVRHLVDANDDFELLILCWEPGQESRCHNHMDSHGWVTVLEGTTEEIRYKPTDLYDNSDDEGVNMSMAASPPKNLPNTLGASRPCPRLEYLSTGRASRGDGSLYINDSEALHVVRCPTEVPMPGTVTLHLYSPPITRVTLYDPEEDKVINRIPGYFTIRGQKA